MSLAAVSNILRRERNVLEQLLFKLTEEQRVLTAHDPRALAAATRAVEDVLQEVGQTELLRAMEVQLVADDLELDGPPSLRRLLEAAPSPWSTILRSHYEALRALSAEITRLARARQRLSHETLVAEAIESLRIDIDLDATDDRSRVCASLVDFLR